MKRRFDNYEISKVAEYAEDPPAEDGRTTYCEPIGDDEEKPEGALRVMWTLYGHLPEGGVMAIADCSTKADCEEIRDLITGGAPTDNEIDVQDLKVPFVILVTEEWNGTLRASMHSNEANAKENLRSIVVEGVWKIKRHEIISDYWHGTAWRDALCDVDNLQRGGR